MRRYEIFIAFVTGITCLGLTGYLAVQISSFQDLWLIPGLYLIQLAIFTCVAVYLIWRDYPSAASIMWAVTGVMFGFIIITGFSIGPAYWIVAILCLLTGIVISLRRKLNLLALFGILIGAAVAQAAFMLLLTLFI
jgi:hypothetical protein